MEISYGLVILLLTALYFLHKLLTINFDYWKKRNVFFLPPTPFFGNFYDVAMFKSTTGEFLAKLYNQTNEPFFGIYVFNIPILVVKSPELVKTILVKDFNNFADRTIATTKHDPFTSEMLFLSKNPVWRAIRTKLTPVFTSGKLKGMFPHINKVGVEMNKYIEKINDGNSIEAKEVCAKYSTDVIAVCAFAINAHSFESEEAEFRKVGKNIFDFSYLKAIQQTSFFFLPGLVQLFRMKFIPQSTTDFLEGVFWKAIKQREKTGVKGNDLLDIIMDIWHNDDFRKEYKFEGTRVVAQAGQFFSAGFETTSSTMAFTLYELCLHPHIQKKLRQEIKSAIGSEGITYESVLNLPYLNLCVMETLRKYPVLPFLDRRCNTDYTIPGTNTVLEKGTAVYIPMFGLHYDEQYFPNPNEFNPERFAENDTSNIKGFNYIPFGEGPRNCIGARFGLLGAKAGLVHILSEYEVERSSDTPVPLEYEPKSFVLQSKVGLPMKFKRSPLI